MQPTVPVGSVQLVLKLVFCFTVLALTTNVAEAVSGAPKCSGTRLVVLAGPRRSATSSVAEFMYKYARGAQPHHKSGKTYHPLANFRWPLVFGEYTNQTEIEYPYKRFNQLVTDPTNTKVQNEILEAIKTDYEQVGVNAVIFGGEEFDQVGISSPEGYDAIAAVKIVVDYIQVPGECVTILLNYRVPRFEHWLSLYSSLTVNDEKDPPEYAPYEEHMCEDKTSTHRLEELGTSMNPMYLAEMYLNAEGGAWNVQMIDMGGIEEFETDISHTIGCNILGGKCDDEGRWVKGHIEETITNKALQRDFKSLPAEEIVQSEKLFRYRDCSYEEDLRNNERFGVVMNQTIWAGCQHDEDHEWVYQSFRDPKLGTHLVFDALLSQVDCKAFGGAPAFGDKSRSEALEAAKIEDFLSGTYQTSHGFLKSIEEDVGSFSAPMILVILMFAGGAGFYAMKVKNDPGYVMTIPSFEMGGITDGVIKRGGSAVRGFTDNMGFAGDPAGAKEGDDESSSSEEDSDSDSDVEEAEMGGFKDEGDFI